MATPLVTTYTNTLNLPGWAIVLIIVGSVVIVVAALVFAFWAIKHANKKNVEVKNFALQNGFTYEKCQAGSYQQYSKDTPFKLPLDLNKFAFDVSKEWNQNPYLKKYAPFSQYPFAYGTNVKVANAVSGVYKGYTFYAYTYMYLKRGGNLVAFEIEAIWCEYQGRGQIADRIFFENGFVYKVSGSSLKTERVMPNLDELIEVINRK
jgi:hypothetical protein